MPRTLQDSRLNFLFLKNGLEGLRQMNRSGNVFYQRTRHAIERLMIALLVVGLPVGMVRADTAHPG